MKFLSSLIKCILTQRPYIGNGKELIYSATVHWAEEHDANCHCHRMFFDISFRFMSLDCVTLFSYIKSVRNTCKRLRYSETFGGISSVQWSKLGRI